MTEVAGRNSNFISPLRKSGLSISLLLIVPCKMSGTGNREAVFPTRMNLTLMKTKLKGANTGHSLLKRKSEALTKRFREITRRIDTAKRKMSPVMQIASFSLAEVTYAAGDVGYHVQESVKSARFKVRARQDNVR